MDKDIRFTQKRVDESWKENVSTEKKEVRQAKENSIPSFSSFITSIGIQALLKLGMLEPPKGEKVEVDLEGAREAIDLLLMLKEKTKGNLNPEEDRLLTSLIADLQIRFVEHPTV